MWLASGCPVFKKKLLPGFTAKFFSHFICRDLTFQPPTLTDYSLKNSFKFIQVGTTYSYFIEGKNEKQANAVNLCRNKRSTRLRKLWKTS